MGGMDGWRIELVVRDTQTDPDAGIRVRLGTHRGGRRSLALRPGRPLKCHASHRVRGR
jgi:hypothetical protein